MSPQNTDVMIDNYEQLSEDAPSSIVWASTGPDGSGKSWFALTAPSPIFVCAFDPYGMNRVSKDVKAGKDIRIARYPFNPQGHGTKKDEIGRAAEMVWRQFRADYEVALSNVRTIIIDREDLAYELLRYARFGAQSDAPKEYGQLYIEYAWLIQEAQAHGVNLGIIRGVREEWKNKFDPAKGKMVPYSTGVMIPDGMKKIADYSDVTLDHRWDGEQRAFMTKIGKFTNIDEKDMEYPGLTFPDMATLAYPESTTENWQ